MLGAGEVIEGHGGQTFEVGGVRRESAGGEQLFDNGKDAVEGGGEIGVGDVSAVDADALVDALEVRRGIKTSAQAGSAKDGVEKSGGGTFAVGAGNMDTGHSAVGIAESFCEDGDVAQVEFLGAGVAGRGQLAAERQ